MAIDQPPSTSPPDSMATPAIDNEFPTYRAISSTAVLSTVFGLASVFSFADLWFLLLAAGAVILGLYSLRKIRQLPDVLTGAGLARVGIGIGLLFGLSALTQVVTENISINLDAGEFAKFYVRCPQGKAGEHRALVSANAAYRKENSPDQLVEDLKKSRSQARSGDSYQQAAKPIVAIKERLDGGNGGEISYSGIESKAIDGLTIYANALVKLDLKGTKEHPEKEAYALIQLVKGPEDWVVREVLFPYTPKSAIAVVEKKDDDGHGH